MKLKITISVLFSFLIVCSCKYKGTNRLRVTADLSFRSITFTTAYKADNNTYETYIKDIKNTINNYKIEDSVNYKKSASYQNYLLCKHILELHELEMLKLPEIYLNFDADSVITVHISEKEYEKIKHFNQVDLFKEKKKIVLDLYIEKKSNGVYYSDNIISVNKVDGESKSNIFKKQ